MSSSSQRTCLSKRSQKLVIWRKVFKNFTPADQFLRKNVSMQQLIISSKSLQWVKPLLHLNMKSFYYCRQKILWAEHVMKTFALRCFRLCVSPWICFWYFHQSGLEKKGDLWSESHCKPDKFFFSFIQEIKTDLTFSDIYVALYFELHKFSLLPLFLTAGSEEDVNFFFCKLRNRGVSTPF